MDKLIKERGIIFNGEMVRAILSGSKTQMRRVIKSPATTLQNNGTNCIVYREAGDPWYKDYVFSMRGHSGVWNDYTLPQFLALCPFGQVGDRLWVRETFRVHSRATDVATIAYKASERQSWTQQVARVPIELCTKQVSPEAWTPSIHMPRWASRITLEITDIRVERLNDISEADAINEGLIKEAYDWRSSEFPMANVAYRTYLESERRYSSPKQCYQSLWESIYGQDSWQSNPFVWVVEFKRVEV